MWYHKTATASSLFPGTYNFETGLCSYSLLLVDPPRISVMDPMVVGAGSDEHAAADDEEEEEGSYSNGL